MIDNQAFSAPHAWSQNERQQARPAKTQEGADLSRTSEPKPRSPLPSARDIDAAIARKYDCQPYREWRSH